MLTLNVPSVVVVVERDEGDGVDEVALAVVAVVLAAATLTALQQWTSTTRLNSRPCPDPSSGLGRTVV